MQKTRFPAVLSTFVLCFAFWVLLTWSFEIQELAAGAVVSLAAALFASRFFIQEKAFRLVHPRRFFSLLVYVFVFLGELLKANLDVARRCFGGCKDVNPGIVKVPVDLPDRPAPSRWTSPRRTERITTTSTGSTSPRPTGSRPARSSRAGWRNGSGGFGNE